MIEIINKYWYIPTIALVIGFFIGRSNTPTKEVIKYVKGETVYDSIQIPYPVSVIVPTKPVLPVKPDTIIIDSVEYKFLKVDTSAIIVEYISRKIYRPILFDNKDGKIVLNLAVQYNKLDGIGYEFTPIHKETTKIIERTFTPFINVSYNSFGYIGAGGGVYYKNIGVGARYITDFNKKGLEITGYIKF